MNLARYRAIAAVVVAIISASQFYWLRITYCDTRLQILRELNMSLKSFSMGNMEKFLEHEPEQDSTMEEGDLEKLQLLKGLLRQLSQLPQSEAETFSVTVTVEDNPGASVGYDSLARMFARLDQGIRAAFRDNSVDVNEFDVVLVRTSDSSRVDTVGAPHADVPELRSRYYQTDSSGYRFYVAVRRPVLFILGKMKFSILFSGILVLIAVFVFVVFLKTIDTQLALNSQKTDFVNNMTHELKTPLSTCSAALESIVRFNVINDKEKTLKYIGVAENELRRIRTLTEVILTSSAVENRTLLYNFSRVELKQALQAVLTAFELRAQEQLITLAAELPEQPVYVKADALHLGNVFSNALDNAIKYNVIGGSVQVVLRKLSRSAEVCVTNTGRGFPKAYANKVFDKFFRVPTNDIHNVKGYGLGLNYSKHVILAHKGSIDLTSDLDAPTVLTVQLPLHE